jgi:mono/diheme cytochrome c family protein
MIRIMNLRFFISHLYRFRLLILSAICLDLGLLVLSPASQPQAYATKRLPDSRTLALLNYQTNPTPTPFRNPTATPPTLGGHGHDVFYLYCMPCHGDQGQGLTDEFRFRQYPPEDTNCWKSGCHGDRPYDNGFKLPKTVPALIGANTLTKFATARNMFDFMRTAMPFNKPGSLSQEQYLQVLAYLLEQNHIVPEAVQLDPNTLQNIVLRPGATPTLTAPSAPIETESPALWLIGVIILLGVTFGLYLVARSRSPQAPH